MQSTTTATTSSTSSAAKNSSGNAPRKTGHSDFMDMILSQVNAQKALFIKPQAAVAAAPAKDPAATDGDLSAAIDAGDIASLPQDLQKLLQELAAQLKTGDKDASADADTKGAPVSAYGKDATLALLSPEGRQKLLAALQSLMKSLPASQQPTIQTLENGVLKKLNPGDLLTSDKDADTATDGTSALIVSGLTPQQLTDLMQKIKDGDSQDAAGAAGGALASQITLIQLTPPKKELSIPLTASVLTSTPNDKASDAAQAADALAKADDASSSTGDTGTSRMTAMTGLPPADGQNQKGLGSFEHMLNMFEAARHGDAGQTQSSSAGNNDATAGGSAVSVAALQTLPVATDSLLLTGSSSPDSIALAGGVQVTGLPAPTLAVSTMTNLITASPQAIYAHPATQQLAATITKEIDEDNTSLTLRLDPPELGRVSVKMEFRDDKTVKAVVSAEKPETFLMMQRDAHVLQKSLNDAGLDTGSNGLTFELSQDGSAFGQQNRQGNSYKGGKTASANDDTMAIQTKMDWAVGVDGAWHYNVLA